MIAVKKCKCRVQHQFCQNLLMYLISQSQKTLTFILMHKVNNADNNKPQETLKIEVQCPAMYSMSHVMKVNSQIK